MLEIELLAGIGGSPMTATLGCLAIGPTIIWTIALVHWMVMGEIDVVYGFPGIVLGIGLCYVTFDPPHPVYSMFSFGGIVGMLIVFPIARRQMDKREMILIDIEQIERSYETLSKRPGNAVTRFKLAETVYVRGMVGQAIEIAEEAISELPKSLFPEENRMLEKWKRQARDPNLFRPVPCLECGFFNKPSSIYCQQCGCNYLAIYARGRWLGPALTRKLIASWIIAMIALVGLPVTLAIEDLPVLATVFAVVLQIALVGLLVWRAFLHKEDAVV